jgi:hypothetical protein
MSTMAKFWLKNGLAGRIKPENVSIGRIYSKNSLKTLSFLDIFLFWFLSRAAQNMLTGHMPVWDPCFKGMRMIKSWEKSWLLNYSLELPLKRKWKRLKAFERKETNTHLSHSSLSLCLSHTFIHTLSHLYTHTHTHAHS